MEKLKDNFQSKKKFIVIWPVKKVVIKSWNIFWRFGINLKQKRWNTNTTLTYKMCRSIIIWCFWKKKRNSSLKNYTSCPLFERTRFKLKFNVWYDKIWTWIFCKRWNGFIISNKFLIFLRDIVKPVTSI